MKGWYGDKQCHSLASRGVKSLKYIVPKGDKKQNTYYNIRYEDEDGQFVGEQFNSKKMALEWARELIKEGKNVEVSKVRMHYNVHKMDDREEWLVDIETGELGEYIGD